jgi:SpoVK/Ycf46/Vps4 family AAA+-type ATPase
LPGEEELLEVLDAAALAQSGQTSQAGRLAPLDPEARQRASVSAAGLSLSQARRTFVRALRADPALGDAAQALISGEKLRALERDLGLVHVPLVEGPDDLGGLAGFKAWIAERGQAFGPGARAYGLPAPRGVLLVGVQGCGKSLAAKVAAVQLGVPLVRLDLPRVLGAGDGAEESLRRALEAAEANAPLAMWIDEIEKAFAGSGQGEGSDPRSARLLGAFSTWLQERPAPVFVVATANDVSRLPPELMRRGRFDELFFVDLPDLEARRTILALHLRRRGRPPDEFDLQEIALLCEGYSGAELEQVVVGGLHRAFGLHRELVTQDLRRVAQDLVPLYRTYEEQIKALREWARGRARTAGREGAVVDLFRRLEGAAPTVPSV